MSRAEKNSYAELLTKFSKEELRERLIDLKLRMSKMLMMDDIQQVITEINDIEFLLGLNEQVK